MQWILPKTAVHGLKLCDVDLGKGKEVSLRRSTNSSRTPCSNDDATTQPETNQDNRVTKPSNWVKVAGARKVWGKFKSCTAASVKSAITRVYKSNTLKVKRKNKTVGSAQGIQTRWWFILHDSEEALVSLESN